MIFKTGGKIGGKTERLIFLIASQDPFAPIQLSGAVCY
jgi:hypothetical protein